MALGWCLLRRKLTYSAKTRLLAFAIFMCYAGFWVRDNVVVPLQASFAPREPVDTDVVLRWEGDPIQETHPRWQRADNSSEVFVYSAHYDDIDEFPLIRIIAVALDPIPYFYVTCRYYGQHGGPEVRNVTGDVKHNRKRNGRSYLSSFVECPLDKFDNFRPFAVTVDQGNNHYGFNYMIIHYSETDKLTNMNNSAGSDRPTNRKPSGGVTDFAWNVTRCFPAFQLGYDDHVMLAEVVAFSRLLGVERFVFYVQTAGPRVLTMLKVLEAQGDTVVLPFNIYLEEKDLYYAGQFASINDCLYRNLRSSRYVLFGDVDELFVPRDRSSLPSLLRRQFAQNPECGAFLFLNVFFNLLLPPTILPSSTTASYEDDDNYNYDDDDDNDRNTRNKREANDATSGTTNRDLHLFNMLTHTRRHVAVLGPGDRSKPAVNPRKVLTGSVHVVETTRPGFESCVMDEEFGLLHHYRPYDIPPESEIVDDFYLWDFFDQALEEVEIMLDEYEKVVREGVEYTLTFAKDREDFSNY